MFKAKLILHASILEIDSRQVLQLKTRLDERLGCVNPWKSHQGALKVVFTNRVNHLDKLDLEVIRQLLQFGVRCELVITLA